MEVDRVNRHVIRVWDRWTRTQFYIIDKPAVNVLFGTTYINKWIKGTFHMELQREPILARAAAILASSPTSPPIATSVSNYGVRAATGVVEDPRRSLTDAHANKAIRVAETKQHQHSQ